MKKPNHIKSALSTLDIESRAINKLAENLDNNFSKLCDAILSTN